MTDLYFSGTFSVYLLVCLFVYLSNSQLLIPSLFKKIELFGSAQNYTHHLLLARQGLCHRDSITFSLHLLPRHKVFCFVFLALISWSNCNYFSYQTKCHVNTQMYNYFHVFPILPWEALSRKIFQEDTHPSEHTGYFLPYVLVVFAFNVFNIKFFTSIFLKKKFTSK